jgi:hypothetical protein
MPHDSEQHAQHDQLLVVSLAAGDLTGADRDLAASLIVECAECHALHDDLVSIARATAALPAAVRPRDFQLSPEQAARLRPAGWRRFAAAFASPQLAITRQLGVGLTTLGLAGLLVSVLPNVSLPQAGSAGASPPGAQEFLSSSGSDNAVGAPSAAAAAAPEASSAAASAAPAFGGAVTVDRAASPSSDTTVLGPARSYPSRSSADGGVGSEGYQAAQGTDTQGEASPAAAAQRDLAERLANEDQGASVVLVASAILLAAGIALLIARRIARRVTSG